MKKLIKLTAFVLLALCVLSTSVSAKKKRKNPRWQKNKRPDIDLSPPNICGYEGCPKPKPGMLNVHIVPHTHDDVGWLKTVDQYYYGSKTMIQKAGVQYILDSVIQELLSDPNKRFIYVESAFFFKWWKEQTDELQTKVKQLVNEGRLEFIGGAWSMNDEATVHYQSTIDQFTWGLRMLNDTFGECGRPRVGWQIDPFGHTREMASMFAQMGYDGMFFGRLDYQDKKKRLLTKSAEMIWHGSNNLGANADLFTGVLFNNYGPPPGFCFDILCADEPIIDNKWSPDNNVEQRVNAFIKYVEEMAIHYRSNNIILTMGEDFNYQDANMWYTNLDKLILYVNERQMNGSDINLFYSTPSCYLKALHDSDLTWPSKSDDFVPYASDPNAFWTGFYTSRPTVKRFERIGNHFLQVCKQLTALAPIQLKQFEGHLTFFRESMGIMQHHDAVTGTEKQHVANDYEFRLNVAFEACSFNAREILNQLTIPSSPSLENGQPAQNLSDDQPITTSTTTNTFSFNNCLGLNISQCSITEESTNFIVTVYNSLAHSTYQYVRVPVPNANYIITDYRGVAVAAQLLPVPTDVVNLKFRASTAKYELVFMANELPPLGYKSYFVAKSDPSVMYADQPASNGNMFNDDDDQIVIGNQYINLTFTADGHLSSVSANGATTELRQEFFYYEGAAGDNEEFRNRSSGAYIFRPNSTERILSDKVTVTVERGALVEEVHQRFSSWLSQVIRIYRDENHAEFEWLVGAIPIEDNVGKEIVTRFLTGLKTDGVFWTDSNGREMIKRVRNHRDTWVVTLEEKVAGNYYPVTAKIAIEDDESRLSILNDRSQGGSSLVDGSVELMIHRRLLRDDAFGVGEALNETAFGEGLIVRGTHYLTFGSKRLTGSPTMEAQERFIQMKKLIPSWLFFSDASEMVLNDWQKTYTNIYSAMKSSLPQNVNLLTFEPWTDGSILVRFEHLLERNEDPASYSKAVTFNLMDIFPGHYEARETTLAANQWLNEAKRFTFKEDQATNDNAPEKHTIGQRESGTGDIKMTINLDPYGSEASTPFPQMDEDISAEQHPRNVRQYDYLKYVKNQNKPTTAEYMREQTVVDPDVITLEPMQIRTFILTVVDDSKVQIQNAPIPISYV